MPLLLKVNDRKRKRKKKYIYIKMSSSTSKRRGWAFWIAGDVLSGESGIIYSKERKTESWSGVGDFLTCHYFYFCLLIYLCVNLCDCLDPHHECQENALLGGGAGVVKERERSPPEEHQGAKWRWVSIYTANGARTNHTRSCSLKELFGGMSSITDGLWKAHCLFESSLFLSK